MNCVRCGHGDARHDGQGCRVVVVGRWDPELGAFSKEARCGCEGLVRPAVKIPPGPNGCPHEFQDCLPTLCVHCGLSVERADS